MRRALDGVAKQTTSQPKSLLFLQQRLAPHLYKDRPQLKMGNSASGLSRDAGRLHASSSSSPTAGAAAAERLEDVTVAEPRCSRGFTYVMYEANAWQLKFAKSGVTMLVDPWLVGELTFYGQTWAFTGRKGDLPPLDVNAVAGKADIIVITQGLPDHAHKPTMEVLPKDKPLVCSPAAAKVAAEMGFKNIYELDHGKSMDFAEGRLNIRATVGALVGPPWSKRENGFIFTEKAAGGIKLYYEPHCDYQEDSFRDVDSVDAIITPASDQIIANAYPLVQGKRNIVSLLQRLQPKVLVPLINASFPSEGPLSKVIKEDGDLNQLVKDIKLAGLKTVIKEPASAGKSMEVEL